MSNIKILHPEVLHDEESSAVAILGDFFRREDQQLDEPPDLFAQPTSGGLSLGAGVDPARIPRR